MNKAEWVWMPHAAHLIVGQDCRFHLATKVGDYVISTVGEWRPDGSDKFMEIGLDRMYETMVFDAIPHDEGCCPFRQAGGNNLDYDGYNDAGDAYRGHMAMCEKWAAKVGVTA